MADVAESECIVMQAISSLLSLAPATALLVTLDADSKPLCEEVLNANLVHNGDILKVHSCVCEHVEYVLSSCTVIVCTPWRSIVCGWSAYLLLTCTMVLQVLPGARVPADGEVMTGDSYVDEALITGEPLPVVKRPGDAVIGGTVNGSGTFNMQATRVGANTTLNQVRVRSEVSPCTALLLQNQVLSGTAKPFPPS